eukprot:TRINITY_DN73804_c0_g1_i1.p1 TRINITY_DN73804_c0_g1~~TRINITY_DN73804_c0_g1_i1.p1  ORF type:complete len:362 (-),score=43.95 TRINITY_DN73804_c0_g1_i1:45-1130(-)
MVLLASLASTISSGALLWSIVGGCLWGLGPLARKLGVATTCSDARLHELAALTALAYNLGNIMMPAFDVFLNTDAKSRQEVLSNAEWQATLPQLMLAAMSSNIACIVAIYALGRATRHTSCLVALVENGVYCVLSAVLIILLLHESPRAVDYCAMALLTAGILLINSSSFPSEAMGAAPKKTQSDNNLQSDYGSTQTGKRTSIDEESLMPYVYAILGGVLWSFGMLGKRTTAGALPHNLERPGSSVTYLTYQLAGFPVVFLYWCYLSAFGNLPLRVTQDWFKTQGPKVLLLGMIAGIGGSLVTYAFAKGGKNGALISLIADGIYTLIGAGLIAAVYRERPGVWQMIGGLCVLVAVVLPQLK